MIRLFYLVLFTIILSGCNVVGVGPQGFDTKFSYVDNTNPNGYEVIEDPTGRFAGTKVESFRIDPNYCKGDDCKNNSRRSAKVQDIWDDTTTNDKQPSESWYGWYIYLPTDFDPGLKKTDGFMSLVSFKHDNLNCGTSIFQNNDKSDTLNYVLGYATGNTDNYAPGKPAECKDILRQPIYKISRMRGRWTKFEMFANWKNSDDGNVKIYIDGNKMLEYNGVVCRPGCDKFNFFAYGLYIGNVQDLSKLKASHVLYNKISRARKREELLVNK